MLLANASFALLLLVTTLASDEHSWRRYEDDDISVHESGLHEEEEEIDILSTELNIQDQKRLNGVYSLLEYILENHMRDCSIVYSYGEQRQYRFTPFLRTLSSKYRSYSIVEGKAAFSTLFSDVILSNLRKVEGKEICRVYIFDITGSLNPSPVINFLERLQLYLIPHASVIFLGSESHVMPVLKDETFVNTANVLYLVVEPFSKENSKRTEMKQTTTVGLYSRCLFCNASGPGIEFVGSWNSHSRSLSNEKLFKDQFGDFQGYKMRIVQMSWYPLVDYKRDHCISLSVVTPVDSVQVRLLKAVASSLNFTYEMRNPWDCEWGVSTNSGNWTGVVGTLQHHKADVGLSVTYNLGRMKVIDYTRILFKEPMLLVTSKARPPPQYLAIIRPLTVDLWILLAVLSVSAGVVLWGLQIAWIRISGQSGLSYDVSSLYTWSILFEEPASKLPNNTSSLIYVGSWCIFCTFMTAMYKSSLIAHLSVPERPESIDSFEELLEDGGWTWGYANNYSNAYDLLKSVDSPVIRRIFKGMQLQPNELQIERVLQEKHALIVQGFLFRSLKATIRRIRRGVTPFHYGRLEYLVNGDGWGFRQNAPFYDAIDFKLQQMVETGHVDRFLKELVGTTKEGSCEDSQCNMDMEAEEFEELIQDTSGQVVLNLNHLQSAFYLLFIGLGLASIALAGEILYGK